MHRQYQRFGPYLRLVTVRVVQDAPPVWLFVGFSPCDSSRLIEAIAAQLASLMFVGSDNFFRKKFFVVSSLLLSGKRLSDSISGGFSGVS